MRTDDERIALMHRRAAVLRKKRDERRLALSGAASFVLFIALTAAMLKRTGFSPLESATRLTGASLLGENAGVYVLIAVVSFFSAVFITAFCMRRQAKKSSRNTDRDSEGEEKNNEEDQ